MSLKSQHLQFVDIRSFLAPNYSYDDFYCYNVLPFIEAVEKMRNDIDEKD